jgi:arylsulfatase
MKISRTEAYRTTSLKFWIFPAVLLGVTAYTFLYLVNNVAFNEVSSTTSIFFELNQIASQLTASVSTANDTDTVADTAADTNDTPKETKKLNVMVFYPDDWRHDSLGSAGTQPVKTPFLDQLAREGIRFTHNAVTTSICWISRATMFTGQYYSRHKSRYVRDPRFYEYWNESYPYKMQQNGYFIGHIGKWQFSNGGFIEEHYNWSSMYEGSHWYRVDKERVHSTVRDEREAIRFLRERPKDAPFVLTTAFYAPKAIGERTDQHFPMDKTEDLYENVTIPMPVDPEKAFLKLPQFMQDNEYYLEGRRRYKQRFDFNVTGKYERFQKRVYRMITEVDEAIKNVVDELEAQGILNETVIIFTTGAFVRVPFPCRYRAG